MFYNLLDNNDHDWNSRRLVGLQIATDSIKHAMQMSLFPLLLSLLELVLIRSPHPRKTKATKSRRLKALYVGNGNLIFILVHRIALNVFGKHVDLGGSKLASADALFEKQVQFSIRTSSRLRNAEVCVDQAKEARSSLVGEESIYGFT